VRTPDATLDQFGIQIDRAATTSALKGRDSGVVDCV
jgi:hypothetical protein